MLFTNLSYHEKWLLSTVWFCHIDILVTFLNSCIFQTLCYNTIKGDNMPDINSKSDSINEVKGEIKEFFTKRREALNLNVRELGERAGVSYTVIYDLEKRLVLPKIETLLKLAEALGLSVQIKRSQDEASPGLSLLFYKGNVESKKFLLDTKAKAPVLSNDEQLRKLLNLKGLYADDITEIEHFIDFKLSQH